MHQNASFNISRRKKLVFKKHISNGLEVCANASQRIPSLSRRFKKVFKNMFLMVWKYAQMQQNTFFTTPDGKKTGFF
jgi:hypothetical protein